MDGFAEDSVMVAISVAIGILPVFLFLAGLSVMDSYKLVGRAAIARSLLAGVVAAWISYVAHTTLLALGTDPSDLRRVIAPLLEETLKGLWVGYLVRSHRVGFLVDAGIHGFAVGTGFAMIENLYYAWAIPSATLPLWLARGLGTAILHGSTTAIVAIVAQHLVEHRRWAWLPALLPPLALAVATHAAYNHLLFNPLLAAAAILATMPALLLVVYSRSERSTRQWLGSGLDRDVERLELILSGEERQTPIGRYLDSLRERFSAPVLADMLCLLRMHLELSIRAKGILIARAAGVELPADDRVAEALRELRYLERSIGTTGRLAMLPLLSISRRDLWQIYFVAR
jgi:RsiW-degrading membrane proteinase PrsW (M82 family)